MKRIMDGVRVIDLTTYAAGPVCTRILADWGGDVVKIEPLQGETYRWFGLMMGTPVGEDEDPMFEIDNANKRGLALDLKAPEGQAIMHRLLEKADIFVSNYRYDAIARLGFSYEDLAPMYPRLIYGYLNGFGRKGPASNKPGYDFSAYWARGGVMIELGEPDAPPLSALGGFGDHPTGTFLAGGIAAALYAREKTGSGDMVEVSLYHAAIWNMALNIAASYYWENPRKSREDPLNPLVNSYQCKDGKWIILISTPQNHEHYWKEMCTTLEIPECIEDNRFNTYMSMLEHRALFTSIIDGAVRRKTRDEWDSILEKSPFVFEHVQNFHDINADEQAHANEYLEQVTFRSGNKALLATSPAKFTNAAPAPRRLAPKIGEHSREVLSEIGFSSEEIELLVEKKVIRSR
jgi:crotonobetainyl-CoA:carnitine CoA-transferase CaiB-like acyl-CoA transferase